MAAWRHYMLEVPHGPPRHPLSEFVRVLTRCCLPGPRLGSLPLLRLHLLLLPPLLLLLLLLPLPLLPLPLALFHQQLRRQTWQLWE